MPDHHAVLFLSESLATSGYVPAVTDEVFSFGALSIGDVRKIIQSAYATSLVASVKTIVICTNVISLEAQQALLKIFEEPPQSTRFVLVLPAADGLLPTLLSRLYQPREVTSTARITNPFFTMFQSSSYAGRMECIARITKEKDGEQIELLRSGVLWLLGQTPLPKMAVRLAYCVDTMNMRGASKKMLLEEIAMLLPSQDN